MIPTVIGSAIAPALALLPAKMTSPAALVMLLAIGLQESGLTARAQIVQGGGKGPARGLWQFERGGGVAGVLKHPSTEAHASHVCDVRGVAHTSSAVWLALETDDILAAAFARLLLYSDAAALPDVGDEGAAWECYVRNWRPGKPHRDRWPGNYAQAMKAVA